MWNLGCQVHWLSPSISVGAKELILPDSSTEERLFLLAAGEHALLILMYVLELQKGPGTSMCKKVLGCNCQRQRPKSAWSVGGKTYRDKTHLGVLHLCVRWQGICTDQLCCGVPIQRVTFWFGMFFFGEPWTNMDGPYKSIPSNFCRISGLAQDIVHEQYRQKFYENRLQSMESANDLHRARRSTYGAVH